MRVSIDGIVCDVSFVDLYQEYIVRIEETGGNLFKSVCPEDQLHLINCFGRLSRVSHLTEIKSGPWTVERLPD